jgi:hypothetical protein
MDPVAIRAMHYLSPTPAVPNGISPNILVEFNNSKYALPYVGEMFTVEELPPNERNRLPVLQYIIRQKEIHQVMPSYDSGFQTYQVDSPSPLPSPTRIGLFGSLFGISYPNNKYTVIKTEPRESIRAISLTERILLRV